MTRAFGSPEFDDSGLIRRKMPPRSAFWAHRAGKTKWRSGSICVEFDEREECYYISHNWQTLAASKRLIDAFRIARAHMPPKIARSTTPIIAFRGWCLVGDILTPTTKPADFYTWAGPVAHSQEPPGKTSGLYAIREMPGEGKVGKALVRDYSPIVVGVVELYGLVVEHEHGYRAEHAVVRQLWVIPPVGDGIIKLLEDRYQCTVGRWKTK